MKIDNINRSKQKQMVLKKRGILNPHPERVKFSLFKENEFFDSHDLIQVKYEMLRTKQKDGVTVTEASKEFGFCRPSFYRIKRNFDKNAFAGLLPSQRGPKEGYKLTNEIKKFIEDIIKKEKNIGIGDLKKLVEKNFNIIIHRRSIERALTKMKKKRSGFYKKK